MKVSALMATTAQPEWDKFLPTLISQTRPADEIIIVVDRKIDETDKDQFERNWPECTFLFNDKNIGLTASLNRGLKITSGEFIFRADDDDSYREDRIEKQLACFQETGADLVCSWAHGSAADGNGRKYLIKCPTENGEIRRQLKRRNILIHSSLAIRREALTALGGYDETFFYAQDYALYFEAIRAGYKFAAIPAPLLVRYYRPENISVSRRYHQLIYSCAASVTHHAHSGDRFSFLVTAARYAILALIPSSVRRCRRHIFSLLGRGV